MTEEWRRVFLQIATPRKREAIPFSLVSLVSSELSNKVIAW